MTSFRVLACFALASLVPAGIACSFANDDAAQQSNEVTSVENTGVKQQAISNCWLYATAGWAESLHKGATLRDVDLSEAYWNLWYWYEQITGGDLALDPNALAGSNRVAQGGWWGLGAEIIRRYGFMYEGDFIPAADPRAERHSEAVRAINASLASGALKTPESRRDGKLVRKELYAAWKLEGGVAADLEVVFAPVLDTRKPGDPMPAIADRMQSGGPLGLTRVHAPHELPVLGADGVRTVTLEDVVGVPAPNTAPKDGVRVGPEAWSERRYAWIDDEAGRATKKAMLKNVQEILNRRLAVPFGWWISTMAKDGKYSADRVSDSSITGLHESIFVDYEVEDVPGFGTLRVDERETRPAALEAALDDKAKVTFFRIKNSWGTDPGWSQEELRQFGLSALTADAGSRKAHYLPGKPGFNDLTVDFLDRGKRWDWSSTPEDGHMLVKIALPPVLRF
jgi:hypothetical protein